MRNKLAVLLLIAPTIALAQSSYMDANRKMETCENVGRAVGVYSSRLEHKESFYNKYWNWVYPQNMFSVVAMKEFKKESLDDYQGMRGRKWGWAWCMDNYGKQFSPLTQEEYDEVMRGGAISKPASKSAKPLKKPESAKAASESKTSGDLPK